MCLPPLLVLPLMPLFPLLLCSLNLHWQRPNPTQIFCLSSAWLESQFCRKISIRRAVSCSRAQSTWNLQCLLLAWLQSLTCRAMTTGLAPPCCSMSATMENPEVGPGARHARPQLRGGDLTGCMRTGAMVTADKAPLTGTDPEGMPQRGRDPTGPEAHQAGSPWTDTGRPWTGPDTATGRLLT